MTDPSAAERFKARLGSSRRGSTGFVTIATVIAVVASMFAILVGANEKAGLLDLLNGHTWLRDTRTGTLSLANDSSGLVDFNLKISGAAGSNIQVTEDGRLAVLVDPRSKTYAAVDLARYGTTGAQKVADPDATDIVLAKKVVYVIDRVDGVIEKRDGSALGKLLARVKLGGDLTRGVLDDSGRLWVADSASGKVFGLSTGGNDLQVDETVPVADPKTDLELAVVDGRPTVVDVASAVVLTIDGSRVGSRVRLPIEAGESMEIPREVRGAPLPVAVNSTGRVILVDGSDATSVPLEGRKGATLGEPAVFTGNIYVPDERAGDVIILDRTGQVLPPPVRVRETPGPIDVVPGAGVIYLQAPDGTKAVQIDEDGNRRTVSKTGPDIPTNDEAPQPDPPPVETPPPPPPGPIVNIAASPPGAPVAPIAGCNNKKIIMSWGPAPENGAPVTGYVLTWTASKGQGGTQTVGNVTTYDITGLTNGTTYTVSVSAQSAAGPGPAAQATPCAPTSANPDVPDGVKAVADSEGRIQVAWNPADDGRGNPVTRYVVKADGIPPKTVDNATTISMGGPEGIVVGTTYRFTVQSQNTTGSTNVSQDSQPSNPVKAHSVPRAPSAPTVTPTGRGTARVEWAPCSPQDSPCTGGETITGYVVAVEGGPQTSVGGQVTSYDLTLPDGALVSATVIAKNVVGDSSPSPPGTGRVGGPPAVVGEAHPRRSTGIFWTGVNGDPLGGPPISSCSVTVTGGAGTWGGLPCGDNHKFTVQWSSTFDVVVTVSNAWGTTTRNIGPVTTYPRPSVSISRPRSAVGEPLTSGNGTCTHPSCAWIKVSVRDFIGPDWDGSTEQLTIRCYNDLPDGGNWKTYTVSANSDGAGDFEGCFFGYPGYNVWVTVESNVLNGALGGPIRSGSIRW